MFAAEVWNIVYSGCNRLRHFRCFWAVSVTCRPEALPMLLGSVCDMSVGSVADASGGVCDMSVGSVADASIGCSVGNSVILQQFDIQCITKYNHCRRVHGMQCRQHYGQLARLKALESGHIKRIQERR